MTCWCSMTASPGRTRATARFPPSRERSPARHGQGRSSSGCSRTGPPPAGPRKCRIQPARRRWTAMPRADASRRRCAIYTRKSSEEGLEQEFNSLAAQCEACEAFIRSQRNEGWVLVRTRYDDGGFSGGNLERPALQQLIADIRAGRIDIVVVYKVDRLTRSLADFTRLYPRLLAISGATLKAVPANRAHTEPDQVVGDQVRTRLAAGGGSLVRTRLCFRHSLV